MVSHYSLLSDLFRVPEMGNQQLKIVKDKHCLVGAGTVVR